MRRHFPPRILLCICLLVCLIGCAKDAPADPTNPVPNTTSTTETTTQLPPDAKALYAEAVQASPSDIGMAIFIDRQVRIADTVVTASSEQSIIYLGLGTDELLARINETATYGDYDAKYEEIYTGGTLYATVSGESFSMELSPEDLTARYLPPVLLDASLYGSLTCDDNGTFTFSEATALESWLLEEDAEILDIQGTASVSNGTISEASYTATYAIGGAEITLSVRQLLLSPDDAQITAPANTDAYRPVESVDALKLVDQAYGYLLKANIISASVSESTVSHAAGTVLNTLIDVYDVGKDPMFQLDQSIYYMDYSQDLTETADILEVFRNGKYTYTQDDSRPAPNASITAPMMRNYYQNILTEYTLDVSYLQNAVLTDVGGIYLAEFTCTEAFGDEMGGNICENLYGDAQFLNELSSDYRNEALDFYTAVDKYTGLPTAMGIAYEGVHTIDGYEYILSKQVDYSFDLAGLEVYETITEEPAPETEPEEKAVPLFYHVTGPDGQEMWLLGTIHVGDVRTGFLPQEIYDAFSASDALAIECNNTAFEEQVEQDDALSEAVSDLYFYSDGTTVKDHVDAALYEDAVKLMKATGNYNMNTEYMKPVLWYQALSDSLMSQGHILTRSKGVESRLEHLAEEQGKPIWEIESNMFQLEMLTDYSDDLQEQLLWETVYLPAKENWEGVQELYELWCSGDEAALIEAMRDDTSEMTEEELALYNEYNEAISVDRNVGMLEAAKQYLESGDTVFYAVGLAHLLAENGLVFTLRDAGYTVELVTYN